MRVLSRSGRRAARALPRDERGRLRALARAAVASGTARVRVIDPGRTAVAVFNVAKVDVSSSTITGGDPHGVCARGEAYVAIRDSRVVGAADRACYAYMSARLDLARTEVSANDASAAAIQVEALRPSDAARLVLDDVVVSEATRGRGVSVAGKVAVTLEGAERAPRADRLRAGRVKGTVLVG